MGNYATIRHVNAVDSPLGASPIHQQPSGASFKRETKWQEQSPLPSRKPLFDSVKTHHEKFQRVHKEFKKLGEGQTNSLAPKMAKSSKNFASRKLVSKQQQIGKHQTTYILNQEGQRSTFGPQL